MRVCLSVRDPKPYQSHARVTYRSGRCVYLARFPKIQLPKDGSHRVFGIVRTKIELFLLISIFWTDFLFFFWLLIGQKKGGGELNRHGKCQPDVGPLVYEYNPNNRPVTCYGVIWIEKQLNIKKKNVIILVF